MEIKHLKHSEINFKKWDKTILSSKFPLVFSQSFFLNATCPNWEALIIGDYDSVFALTKKTKYGITYLHQPPFTPQLGAYGVVNSKIEQQFYNYIIKKFKLVEVDLNASNTFFTENHAVKNTYIIDYKLEYQLNKNTKRNIAKANENTLKVERISTNEILIKSQKHLNPFLNTHLKLSTESISFFDQLIKNAIEQNYVYTFQVIDSNSTTKAIAHFLYNGNYALYLKGANFDKDDNTGSMHLLINYAVEFFKDKAKIFDFGGGAYSQGLATFYKGLGGQILSYSFLRVNNLPWYIKLIKK